MPSVSKIAWWEHFRQISVHVLVALSKLLLVVQDEPKGWGGIFVLDRSCCPVWSGLSSVSYLAPPQKLFGTSIQLQLRHLEHFELFTVQFSIFNLSLYIYKTIAFSFLASTTTASSESSLFSEISTLRLVRFFSWWWIWKSKKASFLRRLMMI